MKAEEVQGGSYWSGLKRISCVTTSASPQDAQQGPQTAQSDECACTTKTVVKRRLLGLWTVLTSVTETHTARKGIDKRHSLERVDERVHRRVTARGNQVLEDELRELTVVEDHLGRVHSARVATHRHGRLVSEAAALYLPAGLTGKAVEGSHAAGMSVGLPLGMLAALSGGGGGLNGGSSMDGTAAGMRGGSGSGGAGGGSGSGTSSGTSVAAAVACHAVGYACSQGQSIWGVISDPEALGLPAQRPVTRASLDRARPPPWQSPPAGKPPLPPQQRTLQQQQQRLPGQQPQQGLPQQQEQRRQQQEEAKLEQAVPLQLPAQPISSANQSV